MADNEKKLRDELIKNILAQADLSDEVKPAVLTCLSTAAKGSDHDSMASKTLLACFSYFQQHDKVPDELKAPLLFARLWLEKVLPGGNSKELLSPLGTNSSLSVECAVSEKSQKSSNASDKQPEPEAQDVAAAVLLEHTAVSESVCASADTSMDIGTWVDNMVMIEDINRMAAKFKALQSERTNAELSAVSECIPNMRGQPHKTASVPSPESSTHHATLGNKLSRESIEGRIRTMSSMMDKDLAIMKQSTTVSERQSTLKGERLNKGKVSANEQDSVKGKVPSYDHTKPWAGSGYEEYEGW
ncbi:hypothetical protein F5Y18DRAFT_426313 [Xylariaceae sp. FL1019]|nr:hypothetical protein F5Y18DRAFT_426313 [Xylariaceae sp. FL1019]